MIGWFVTGLLLFIELLILWELSYWVLFMLFLDISKPVNKPIPKRDKVIVPPKCKIIQKGNYCVIPDIAQISSPNQTEQQTEDYHNNKYKNNINKCSPIRMSFRKFLILMFDEKETNYQNNNESHTNKKGVACVFPHDLPPFIFHIIKRLSTKCKENHE